MPRLRMATFLTSLLFLLLLPTALAAATALSQQSTPVKSGYRILFDSTRQKRCGAEIYVMDPDGSHQQRLTHTPGKGKYTLGARWSPDRGKILFDSDRDGNREIFVMDADGSNVRRLTRTTGEIKMKTDMGSGCAYSVGGNYTPAWSPDGRKIVFDSDRDGSGFEIYVMDADGSNVRRLTHTPGEGLKNITPDWSPDGKKIAFVSPSKGSIREAEIYVMEVDGSHIQRLTNTPGRYNLTPRWSPDGERIVFISDRDGDAKNENSEIYVMNADGSDVRQLTRFGFGAGRPSWSPDGKRIVFTSSHHAKSTDDKDVEIYVMDADGTNVRRLTFNKAHDGHPGW